MPRHTTITIHGGGGEPSRSNSYHSEGESSRHDAGYSAADEDEEWEDYPEHEDDLLPSDSASATNDIPPARARHVRTTRRHRAPRPASEYPPVQAHAPIPPPSVDPSEDYPGPYGPAYQPQPPPRGGYYGGRGQHHGYQQGPYVGGYPSGNQMVPYGGYAPNPFTPISSSSGASYFSGPEPRHPYDMMPYQQVGYFPGPQYSLPQHLQQFHLTPPVPPATEGPGQSTSPGAKDGPADLERVRLVAQIAALKAQEQKVKAAEEQREREAQIRKEAEENFQRRMDDIKKAQEEAQREIQRARAEAERTARDRIEAERKADEERKRQHEEAMKRAEEKARLKFEAEMKAAEARRKKEEEDRARAEEAAKIRLEAAIKAEAAAKAAAEKRTAEEAERLKAAQEEARRKAEAETLAKVEEEKAKAKKAAEDAEAAKKEQEALTKRIQAETKASMEEAAKKSDQLPIKFKDAVGRKFSFPFHLCRTWQGMEELIKQAFLQVDVLGPHVQEGHYDITGPNGEIILPSVWERVIQPDWSVTMTMWPLEKAPLMGPKIPGMPNLPGRRSHHGIPIPPFGAMPSSGRRQSAMGQGFPPGMVPPPGWGSSGRRSSTVPPNIDIVDVGPGPVKSGKGKKNSAMLGFFAGKPSKKKSSKK